LTAPYCYNNLSVFCFLFSLSTEVGGVGGSRCRWAGQCNDSGRRRSLVLVPRNTRYPPVEGVTKGPLSLSLPMDDELSAQSQAQFLPGFLAHTDATSSSFTCRELFLLRILPSILLDPSTIYHIPYTTYRLPSAAIPARPTVAQWVSADSSLVI